MIIDLCAGKNCLIRNTCKKYSADPVETMSNPHKGKKFRLSPTLQKPDELECSKYNAIPKQVKFYENNH